VRAAQRFFDDVIDDLFDDVIEPSAGRIAVWSRCAPPSGSSMT
jgi:hypothetical protein